MTIKLKESPVRWMDFCPACVGFVDDRRVGGHLICRMTMDKPNPFKCPIVRKAEKRVKKKGVEK
jgi:hypothetical protein